jgi:hypothetical protein
LYFVTLAGVAVTQHTTASTHFFFVTLSVTLLHCRFAGIGGLSEALGWTEVQQEYNQGQFLGGVENILKFVALILLADVALFGYEQIAYMMGNPLQ